MKIFGYYNHILMALASLSGLTVAAILNWLLGNVLRSCPIGDELFEGSSNYQLINKYLQQYWYLPILLVPIPIIGSFITLVLGLYKLRLYKLLLVFIPIELVSILIKLQFY